MTSRIVVNNIQADAGVSTVTFSSNIQGNLIGNVSSTGVSTFTSGIVVSAGSTSAPSISPTGYSNTGIFFPSPDTIAFGEGGTESFRLDSSGNVSVANGNLVFSTAGKGIDFSATANSSGTMTSELLDDYETGSLTATLVKTTGGASLNINGGYVKIGKIVTVYLNRYALGNDADWAQYNKYINSAFPFTPVNMSVQGTWSLVQLVGGTSTNIESSGVVGGSNEDATRVFLNTNIPLRSNSGYTYNLTIAYTYQTSS